jgi:hypothetical protein
MCKEILLYADMQELCNSVQMRNHYIMQPKFVRDGNVYME